MQADRPGLRRPVLAVALAIMLGAMPLLGGCQTTANAGSGIANAGDSLTQSAKKHTP
jgi:predicted small secreted protein